MLIGPARKFRAAEIIEMGEQTAVDYHFLGHYLVSCCCWTSSMDRPEDFEEVGKT